ncbi:MAG: phosphotransferase [Planctomycetota bacterium]
MRETLEVGHRDTSDAEGSLLTKIHEVESLGVSLEPALRDACGDRLGSIEWFRSPWQRSGAATGRTWWRLPSGEVIRAIAKVPVGYREWYWTTELGATDPMRWDDGTAIEARIPRVLSSGIELASYDVAWMVVEAIDGVPLNDAMTAANLGVFFEAVTAFHRGCLELKPPALKDKPSPPMWATLLEKSRKACDDNPIAMRSRWLNAIEAVQDRLPALLDRWNARPITTWCHGDLHPGNAIIRDREPTPSCALIDLGLIHAGHWVEDALYIERLHWGFEEKLCGIIPEAELSARRVRAGLRVDPDDHLLANIRRVLMAATSPGFMGQEGEAAYLDRALEHIELLLHRIPES